jgi:hypothetical protein
MAITALNCLMWLSNNVSPMISEPLLSKITCDLGYINTIVPHLTVPGLWASSIALVKIVHELKLGLGTLS